MQNNSLERFHKDLVFYQKFLFSKEHKTLLKGVAANYSQIPEENNSLYIYLKQISQQFQFSLIEICGFYILLQRVGWQDFKDQYQETLSVYALMTKQLFSSEDLEKYQLFQEIKSQGGFTNNYNNFIQNFALNPNIIQIKSHQLNQTLSYLRKQSQSFLTSKSISTRVKNISLLKTKISQIKQKAQTEKIQRMKKSENTIDNATKMGQEQDLLEIVKVVNKQSKIAFVKDISNSNIQWQDLDQAKQNLVDQRTNFQLKEQLKVQINLFGNGIFSVSKQREMEVYNEEENSEEEVQPNQQVLAIKQSFMAQLTIYLQKLQTSFKRVYSAIQNLSYQTVFWLANYNLIVSNGYLDSDSERSEDDIENMDENELEEFIAANDAFFSKESEQ